MVETLPSKRLLAPLYAFACIIEVNGLSPVVEARRIHIGGFQLQVSAAVMLKSGAHAVFIKGQWQGVNTCADQAAAFIPACLSQPYLPPQFICSFLKIISAKTE